ncbi:10504_t:CDS:2, partial [Cetraspora pellucida]
CEQDLTYHQSTTAMKTHLAAFHHITKTTVEKNQSSFTSQQLLPKILSDVLKTFHSIKKQKELNQYLVKFIVRTVQSLQLVEASDFINFYFESKNILLSIAELPYPHEASQILEHIKNLLQIWNLELKIISFTTDNGANIKKAIKDLGIGTQIFCAAHTLQLSINKGLEEISELIGKLNQINESSNINNNIVKNIKEIIQEDMNERWELANELGLYSSFFDIRFKNLSFVLEKDKQDFIEIIHTEYEVLCTISDTDINKHILPNTSQKGSTIIGKLRK